MFKQNDRSYTWIRKIVNVLTIVLMFACLIAGVVMMASSQQSYWGGTYFDFGIFFGGLAIFFIGPIVINFLWLFVDCFFNTILDIKIIRNAVSGENVEEVAKLSKPIVPYKEKKDVKVISTYELLLDKLLAYKKLLDEGAISQTEYDAIKAKLMPDYTKDAELNSDEKVFATIEKLKKLTDDGVITEEEFAKEKAKLLK